MKKSSKIWKIEKFRPRFIEGVSWEIFYGDPFREDKQLIYETELDCLLDIVTEPENFGLKVYKHQSKIVREADYQSEIEVALILKGSARWCSESVAHSREYIEKLDLNSYKFINQEHPHYIKMYKETVYHWVEAFLQ